MMSEPAVDNRIEGEAELRVYLDATMIRACRDPQRAGPVHGLVRQAVRDEVVLVVSDLTMDELRDAPPEVRDFVDASILPRAERVSLTAEALELADQYVQRGVVSPSRLADARHVAAATVAGVDVLGSWNYRIVNWKRNRRWNVVNRLCGYGPMDSCDPRALEYGMSDPEPEVAMAAIDPGQEGFRVMPWLRAVRAQIYEETKHMTAEERRRSLDEMVRNDPLFSRLPRARVVTPRRKP